MLIVYYWNVTRGGDFIRTPPQIIFYSNNKTYLRKFAENILCSHRKLYPENVLKIPPPTHGRELRLCGMQAYEMLTNYSNVKQIIVINLSGSLKKKIPDKYIMPE